MVPPLSHRVVLEEDRTPLVVHEEEEREDRDDETDNHKFTQDKYPALIHSAIRLLKSWPMAVTFISILPRPAW